MYKKMLVPLDGSELSEVVFPYARELAGRLGLEVFLLHVKPKEDDPKGHLYRDYILHKVDILKCQADEVREGMAQGAKCTPVKVHGEVVCGHPAAEILDYAAKNSIDFILIATHGHSGIRRLVMGSVAQEVIQASKLPVWLVRAASAKDTAYDQWPHRTILVPLDGSGLAENVLPHVETLAKQCGADASRVALLTVCQPPGKAGSYFPDIPEDLEAVKRYLSTVEQRLRDKGLNVTAEVKRGHPAEEIVKHARENPFNVIVMSTHARSGLSRLTFGSVAEKVIHEAQSPIFLVRPK